jgi:hypothetical protein
VTVVVVAAVVPLVPLIVVAEFPLAVVVEFPLAVVVEFPLAAVAEGVGLLGGDDAAFMASVVSDDDCATARSFIK